MLFLSIDKYETDHINVRDFTPLSVGISEKSIYKRFLLLFFFHYHIKAHKITYHFHLKNFAGNYFHLHYLHLDFLKNMLPVCSKLIQNQPEDPHMCIFGHWRAKIQSDDFLQQP